MQNDYFEKVYLNVILAFFKIPKLVLDYEIVPIPFLTFLAIIINMNLNLHTLN